MAVYAVTSPDIYIGQQDLSGDLHTIQGTIVANALDVTNFGSGGWRQRITGLHDINLAGDGYLSMGTGNVEEFLYTVSLGTVDVITIGETDGTDGSPAAIFQALHVGFDNPEKVGAAAAFKASFKGSSLTARGIMLSSKATQTTNGNGTIATSVAATATTSKLYSTLHVFSASGTNPTLKVSVISATTSGFGATTTRLSFSTATTASAQWGTPTAGPIADTNYRISWVIGGTSNPTFTFAVGLGIL